MVIKRIKDAIEGKAPLTKKRSSKWPTVRKNHLKRHCCCEVCGTRKNLEVHHIVPFHTNPELELHSSNLITLCECKSFGVNCHLFFGHLGDYKSINPNVVKDVEMWREKLKRY